MVDIATLGTVSVPEKSALAWKHLAERFPKAYRSALAPWHPLGCRAIGLGKPRPRGDRYAPSYTGAPIRNPRVVFQNQKPVVASIQIHGEHVLSVPVLRNRITVPLTVETWYAKARYICRYQLLGLRCRYVGCHVQL